MVLLWRGWLRIPSWLDLMPGYTLAGGAGGSGAHGETVPAENAGHDQLNVRFGDVLLARNACHAPRPGRGASRQELVAVAVEESSPQPSCVMERSSLAQKKGPDSSGPFSLLIQAIFALERILQAELHDTRQRQQPRIVAEA